MANSIASFSTTNLGPITDSIDLSGIIDCRGKLQEKSLIGKLSEGRWAGYDYGNISVRHNNGVLISASQKSSTPNDKCGLSDFALVTGYDPVEYRASFYGDNKPSSETPFHWTMYQADNNCNAVLHGHIVEYSPLFSKINDFVAKNNFVTTQSKSKSDVIASEISDLIKSRGPQKIICMNNHDGGYGVIATGNDIFSACKELVAFYDNLERF